MLVSTSTVKVDGKSSMMMLWQNIHDDGIFILKGLLTWYRSGYPPTFVHSLESSRDGDSDSRRGSPLFGSDDSAKH
jgi:hypothetical protein